MPVPASPSPDSSTDAYGTDAMFDAVYERLKAMAGKRLAANPGSTLQTTVVVHELYLRMHREQGPTFADPARFFAYAARAMRHLLLDHARNRLRSRAGGEWRPVALSDAEHLLAIESAEQAIELEDVLRQLEAEDERAARVVELVFFAGLSLEKSAGLLGISRRTADRDWRFARAFLGAGLG